MKISVVQFTPEFLNKDENLKSVLSHISETRSELIVFPELALTGYFFQSREESAAYAEPFDGPSIMAIAHAASKENKIVVIGFAELDDDKIYNSAALLFPDKKLNVRKVPRNTAM
jgi:predicted amidohydrolase